MSEQFRFAPENVDRFAGLACSSSAEDEDVSGFKFFSKSSKTGIDDGRVMPYKAPTPSHDPLGDGSSTASDNNPFRFAKADGSIDLPRPAADGSTFKLAPTGGTRPGSDPFGSGDSVVKNHDGHGHGDGDCGGDCGCSDCNAKAGKLYFSPGTRIRHKLTGTVYTMVSTRCISPDDCYCILRKSNGVEFEAQYYPHEVEAIA